MVAAHKVSHNVFKRWFKGLWVDEVEVDFVIASDLDPLVSFNEEDEASSLNLIVLLPLFDDVSVLILFRFNLKEDNFT